MLGNLTGITSTTRNETVDKKLQEQIDVLKTEVDTIEDQLDALNDNVDTNVVDATTGNIDNVNATSVSSTSVSATNVNGTNGTFNNLTVNGTVQNLSVTNGNIQNIFADDVDTNTLEADSATITALRGTNATIDNLNVTSLKADTVDIGTITDDIDSENASIDDLTSTNVTAQQINTDDIQADTGGIGTLGATTITSNTVNTTDLNATNISASDIDTLRVDASRMTSGIFSLNKDFYINISTNVNDIGVIKMPAFDGVARLSFVNSSEVEQLTMTIINNEVEKKQILVNFSQKAGRLNGFAISADNEFLIGVNGGNIVKMYYTFDTSEEFNAIPEQLPITDFPNDVQYSWLATSELGKTLCFIEPNTPTQGFEVTGMFKAASLEWTSVAIDNLDVIYNLTVRNDAYINNDFHLKTFDVMAAPAAFEEVCGINKDGTIIDNSATVESYERLPIRMSRSTGNFKTTEIITINEDSVYYSLPGAIKGCIETPKGTFAAAGAVGAATGTSILTQTIATCYAFDKTNLTQSTATFSLLMLDDSIVVDNRLTSLDGVYAYTGFATKDSLIIAENIDEFFGFTEQDLVANGTITIQNVEYKRYDFTIDIWTGVLANVYYYPINATEANMEKGILVTDTRYPDEKVDLVNVKAEDAYTADYATKALQDNNGDQIDTTYQKVSEKAQPNGYASLDANGRIPYSQLPESAVEFKGTWDAATNTPTLPTGSDVKGDMYIVNVAGTQMGINWYVGDQAIYDGTTYQRISGSEVGVDTVNGLKDAVTIANSTVNGQTITVDKVLYHYYDNSTNVASCAVAWSDCIMGASCYNTVNNCPDAPETTGQFLIKSVKQTPGYGYQIAAPLSKRGISYKRQIYGSTWGSWQSNVYWSYAELNTKDLNNLPIGINAYTECMVKTFFLFSAGSSIPQNAPSSFPAGNNAFVKVYCSGYVSNMLRQTQILWSHGGGTPGVPNIWVRNGSSSDNGLSWTFSSWSRVSLDQLTTSTLTLAQYNALGTKSAGTLYLITG